MKNHKVEKGCILAALLFVLLWIGGSFPVNAKETGRGRVLFISSYSYAWETIPQQIEGIRKSLGDDVTIDYKFMDTKNVDTAENVHLFYKSLSYYLSQVPAYDVVIVGDDAAYNFVLVYRKIFGNTPIVFEGVNNVSKALAMDYNPNVTGIIENQTYGNTIALAKKIYPEAAHIVAIVDNTVTGLSARKEFYSYKDEFPDLEFSDINASEFSQKDLIKSVESFDESTILLYILCSNDKDGNVYASAESVQMLSSRAHIPMFSGISIGMGKGLLGGEIVSHEEMGEIAGEMAVVIYTDPAECTRIRHEVAIPIFEKRDDRLNTLTDESVDVYYSCILCQAFSPSHVCVVTPERLGLCGAVSWLDAKATNELDPNGPCQVITKERPIDENLGSYEDVDEAVKKLSQGALEHVTLYSIMQDPMRSEERRVGKECRSRWSPYH